VDSRFTPLHRGGSGPPLVCIHGFTDTWRTWELVLPALERRHDVLAPTLVGHAGGPPLTGPMTAGTIADGVERAMDAAGFETAHVTGNSLGGFVALQLAARGRARSVVALAPAGGWAPGDDAFRATLSDFPGKQAEMRAVAAQADELVATPEGRRQATSGWLANVEHVPAELIAHMIRGVAACEAVEPMVAFAMANGYDLDAERITCPVRIVWGTADQVLPWPSAALRFREWIPHAEWVELDGIDHCPQVDCPLETAQLILGLTAPGAGT
jgi:pimeloyl-ACP methyl ester carboxylesterase